RPAYLRFPGVREDSQSECFSRHHRSRKNLQIYDVCCLASLASVHSCKSIHVRLLPAIPYGRLGLAADMPTTAPTATQAPTINPTRMRKDLDLFCFPGATTAPAGLDAGIPVGFS